MKLTDHFTLEELIQSNTAKARGLDNTPSDEQAANLLKLAVTILEPARLLLNTPMKINSGFRCQALNAAIGGVSNSQHMLGQAADFITPETDLNLAFDALKNSDIPFDQLIYETKGLGSNWIHISCAGEDPPRRQVLSLYQRNRKLVG